MVSFSGTAPPEIGDPLVNLLHSYFLWTKSQAKIIGYIFSAPHYACAKMILTCRDQ